MSLSSNYLDAFIGVARQKSFSRAAKKLHITQSAISQRVLNLEQEIGNTLFIRESSGIRLTEFGQRLLRYCQSKELLESELLANFQTTSSKVLSGIIRIAAFSTVTRSVVVPIIAKLIEKHTNIQVEIRNEELRDLPALLVSGGTDFILLTHPLEKQGIENHHIGYEENVLIRSSTKKIQKDVYLDHDDEDSTTRDFLKIQEKAKNHNRFITKRSYLDEIYSIIDGVRYGMGRAVVPLHLARQVQGIEVVSGYKPLRIPVYLTYYSQVFYTDLQKVCIDRLTKEAQQYLNLY